MAEFHISPSLGHMEDVSELCEMYNRNNNKEVDKKTKTWADAQHHGRPAEYRWRPLQKFHNSIPCTTLQSLADARCWSAMQ